MGHRYSVPSPVENQSTESIDQDTSLDTTEIVDESTSEFFADGSKRCKTSTSDHIYVLVHNGQIKYYIQDETLLDSKVQYYMRQVFQEYISRWDAFNFNVVTQEGICCPESGVVKRIRLMSRSRYLLGLHEQIEEEIDIYKIPALPSQDSEESEEESTESEGETEEHQEVNSS